MKRIRHNFLFLLLLLMAGPIHAQLLALESKVIASDRAIGDHFGHHGPVSIDEDLAVAGAHFAEPAGFSSSGQVYVYMWVGSLCTWVQTDIIVAESAEDVSDEANNDNFGRAVSISGNTVVVGSPFADLPGANGCGTVYVYTLSPAGIATFSQQLLPRNNDLSLDHEAGARFGESVEITFGQIICGAPSEYENAVVASPL
jgi:hypothetical protein